MRSFLPRILLVVCLGVLTYTATAEIPRLINYQGRLSASGTPLEGEYTITFSLYDDPENGSAVWSETHEVTVTSGLFNVLLGSLAAFPESLFQNSPELYLGVRVSGESELTPRQRFASTPFSFHAASADAIRAGGVHTQALADGAVTADKLAPGTVVSSVNGAAGEIVVDGTGGIAVVSSGNTITISGEGLGGGNGGEAGVQAVQSDDDALTVENPLGPTVTLGLRPGGITGDHVADDAITSTSVADGSLEAVDLADNAAVKAINGIRGTVTLAGTGGATVTSDGNTITINAGSGGGASGVQGIQNTDGFLRITNPNGPTVTVDVQDSAVSESMIQDAAITADKIANLAVAEAHLANGAVTSAKIADGQVRANDLAADAAVTSINTVRGAVTLQGAGGATIQRSGNTLTIDVSGAGGGGGIQSIRSGDAAIGVVGGDGPTTTLSLNNASIRTSMLANEAVTGAKLADGAVGSAHLAAGAVGSSAIANGAVGTGAIADGAVGTADLQNNAVSTAKLADNAVTGAKIQDLSVGTADLADDAVTGAKVADGSLTGADLADGSIGAADLAPSAAVRTLNGLAGVVSITGANGTSVTTNDGAIVISGGGGGGEAGVQAVQNEDGALEIEDPAGPTVTINVANGGITNAKLAANSVGSGQIQDGAVGTSELAGGAVGTAHLQDGAVEQSKLAAGAVGGPQIQAGAVGATALAANAVGSGTIQDGSITQADLAPGSVGSAQIQNDSITQADIGTGAVGSDEIIDGSITVDDLAGNAAVLSLNGLRGNVTLTTGGGLEITSIPGLNQLRITSAVSSSIRWKRNVEPIMNALDLVTQLRGVRYEWKESGEPDIGFIAEEVGQVLPEVVTWEENGVDARAVDYARIVSVLVEAVKEQQRQIDAQDEALGRLEARLAQIEATQGASASATN